MEQCCEFFFSYDSWPLTGKEKGKLKGVCQELWNCIDLRRRKKRNNKVNCWQNCQEIRTNVQHFGEYIVVQTFWRIVWHYIVNMLTYFYDPEVLVLVYMLTEFPNRSNRESCVHILISGDQELVHCKKC